jgi:type IV pilus assembly protein PilQ
LWRSSSRLQARGNPLRSAADRPFGEEGRIQVGQDFSIRERDFAGNLIDKFYSAGTIIKVKPQVIIEQGVPFIHVSVDVERSSVTPGSVSTIINKTQAQTNLLLLDGEETLIGVLQQWGKPYGRSPF